MVRTTASLLLAALAAPLASARPQAASPYDYIVVGSGPGGGPLAARLARAGYATLLLEAGDDQGDNPNAKIMLNFNAAANDPLTRWDFWVRHTDDDAFERKFEHYTYRLANGSFYSGLSPPAGATPLGKWYPRAGTVGGCAMHNAGVTALPQDHDWDAWANMTGDASWSAANMRQYFVKLENNTWLPKNTPGHGFDGWLSTAIGPTDWAAADSNGVNITRAISRAVGADKEPGNVRALVNKDINAQDPHRDAALGDFGLVIHEDAQGMRSSPNNFIRATLADPAKYPLTLKTGSLVTKVLFDDKAKDPTAVGVEVLEGASLYSADPRWSKDKKGKKVQYWANKEVIISGGTFNTPQILKLSGVGPAAELKKFGIPVVKDLPGVGEHVADNYEAGIIVLGSQPITGLLGPNAVFLNTGPDATNRNIYAWCGQFSFEGYWPGFPTDFGPTEYECALAHMRPRSQKGGFVRLRSADPTDTPDIKLGFYSGTAAESDADLTEIMDAIKTLRAGLYSVGAPVTPWTEVRPCAGKNKQCTDGELKDFYRTQAYSHHATSSCPIGADGDPMAVLDSKFRVRGVKNLRVVDASAFPGVPGSFPVLPTMMLGEKAADVIITEEKGKDKMGGMPM